MEYAVTVAAIAGLGMAWFWYLCPNTYTVAAGALGCFAVFYVVCLVE